MAPKALRSRASLSLLLSSHSMWLNFQAISLYSFNEILILQPLMSNYPSKYLLSLKLTLIAITGLKSKANRYGEVVDVLNQIQVPSQPGLTATPYL